jgi:hypothetical protein
MRHLAGQEIPGEKCALLRSSAKFSLAKEKQA